MKVARLRLGPLPKTRMVKLNIQVSEELKSLLDAYAQRHAEVYGEPVDAEALVPHMLEAFVRRDRGFSGVLRTLQQP